MHMFKKNIFSIYIYIIYNRLYAGASDENKSEKIAEEKRYST